MRAFWLTVWALALGFEIFSTVTHRPMWLSLALLGLAVLVVPFWAQGRR